MQHTDFEQQEKALLRVLCRDAALYATQKGNRQLYRYGKGLLNKFQDNAMIIHLKNQDLFTLQDIVASGIKILESSYGQKDVIDADLLDMATADDEQEEEKQKKIEENTKLFDMNRKQTEVLLSLRDKINEKIASLPLKDVGNE